MPRKKFTSAAEHFSGDPRHNNLLLSKFINCLMLDGKKSVAQKVVYTALDRIGEKIKDQKPLEVFIQAIDNVKPNVEVRSKRVGGANYQVPMPVSSRRQQALAIRWVLQAVRGKSGRPIAHRLADEVLAAYRREGEAMTTRDNIHRMADANKAFSHFAW